jgi:6-phosphogluconolactonase (cycloisomerase 2 family)
VYVGNNGATGDLNPFYVCTVQTSVCTPQDVQNNLMSPLVQVCAQPPCPNVPPTAAGQNPVAQVVDPTNNFLYSLSNGSNQVFGFKINTTTGTLAALSPNPDLPTGSQPVALALHPQVNNTGQFLFVSNSNSDNVTSVNLNTTSGAMTSPSTTVTPATPSGLTAR